MDVAREVSKFALVCSWPYFDMLGAHSMDCLFVPCAVGFNMGLGEVIGT